MLRADTFLNLVYPIIYRSFVFRQEALELSLLPYLYYKRSTVPFQVFYINYNFCLLTHITNR